MPLAKPLPVPATHRSLKCVALKAKTGRLRHRKSCRPSQSATKRMKQGRSPLKVRQKKKALRKSRSGKGRANGAAAAAVEEADAIVLLIVAQLTRQPATVASRRNL